MSSNPEKSPSLSTSLTSIPTFLRRAEVNISITGSAPGTLEYTGNSTIDITSDFFAGATGINVTGGGAIKMNTSNYTYTGPTTLNNGSTMAFTHLPAMYGTSGVTFGSGRDILDISGISPAGSPVFPLGGGGITASSGATIKISIDGAGNCPVIKLNQNGDPMALNIPGLNLIFVLADPAGDYASGQSYTLFENVATGSVVSLGTITGLPSGLTANLESLSSGNFKFKLVSLAPPPPPPPSTPGQSATSVSNTSFGASSALQGTMAGLREDGGGSASISTSSEFTSHPFKAPDVTRDFLNLTEGATMNAAQENLKKWRPLRREKTGVWAQPFGMVLRQVANQGSPGYKTRTGGILFGMDHKVRHDIILGGGIGYAGTNLNCDGNMGKARINDKFATVFGTWFQDKWYVEGALIAGFETYRGNRNTGPNNFATNKHGGYQVTPHVGSGYTFDVGRGYKLRAFASFDFSYCSQQGYQETGSGAMYINHSIASMLRSQGGARLSKIYAFEGFDWEPAVSLSVVNKKPIKKGVINASNGTSFESTTVTTTDISPTLESKVNFEDGYSLSAFYSGEFGSQYNSNQVAIKFSKKL